MPEQGAVPVKNYEVIMTFLQSKDDSLLLQIGALLMSIIMAAEGDSEL